MQFNGIEQTDKEVAEILKKELRRQQDTLILIPSENYASPAVLEAQGSLMSNKYAEGYPGARYYPGCTHVDEMENLARDRLKNLFGAEHSNVQPHSGSQANQAAYAAFLEPGDTFLAMRIDQGGHLTHGAPVNFTGKIYKPVFYGVTKETETIDYNEVKDIAKKEKPKLIVVGASAYPRILDFKVFREIADTVGAVLMADIAHIAGLIAAKLHPDPVPYCDVITSTTHKTLRGPRSGFILCRQEHAKKIDKALFPGIQGGPLENCVAAKAVCFKEALTEAFRAYQQYVVKNAKALADALSKKGFRLVSGGTDNHLMLVDLRTTPLNGKEAQELLEDAGITVNRNVIPYEERPPWITSGLRPGSPAVTSRGMKESEMAQIAGWMHNVLNHPQDKETRVRIRGEVRNLCDRFPIYNSSA